MAVAIVHYHLRRGGVTRVIEAQSQALQRAGLAHVILTGTPYKGTTDLPCSVLPALDYGEGDPALDSAALAVAIRDAAAEALGTPVRTWLLHNPTLGKNAHFPGLVEELSVSGTPLVLQFHDFAEDGRPGNYRMLSEHERVYPIAPQICYAFINSRDRDLLVKAGVPVENTLLLPNAVSPPEALAEIPREPGTPATVLYPVRGIRRKNLGEICLLAALAPPGTRFAITLAPENSQWQEIHDEWVRFAGEHHLQVQFGVVGNSPPAPGAGSDYGTWLSHATHLITTSVAEGFGMAFLEPIALCKPLLGRDLPEITCDFTREGLTLGNLYQRLLVPSSWVDPDQLLQRLQTLLARTYSRYGEALQPTAVGEAAESLGHDGYYDFGRLPEEFQREAVRRALADPGRVLVEIDGEPQPATDWLSEALCSTTPAPQPETLARFSIAPYAEKLAALCQRLQTAEPRPPEWLDKSRVLHQFLEPRRFHALRT